MDKKIVIAIDGFSSCGKSTFAKAIASKLGYVFVDSGAMYRAVTLEAMRSGFVTASGIDKKSIVDMLDNINISFKYNTLKGKSDIYLSDENVEDEIRRLDVSNNVSKISEIAEVRRLLVDLQQKMGHDKGIVMDGRDIGTTVFPNAELKIFMTASEDVRAERRYKELKAKGIEASMEEIKKNISQRDYIDQNREESPLRKADDAIVLDNSDISVQQQMEWVEQLIKDRVS